MDHLIYPHGSLPGLKIPFVCDAVEDYDGRAFFDFPSRRGWVSALGGGQHFTSCSSDQLAIRVQLWLFFGTLSEFCGRVVPSGELRGHDLGEGLPVLDTQTLGQLIQGRRATTIKTHRQEKARFLRKLRAVLVGASQLSEIVEQRVGRDQDALALVSCSVRALIQTLVSTQGFDTNHTKSLTPAGVIVDSFNVRHSAKDNQNAGTIPGWVAESFNIHPAKAVKYAMAKSGWCPSQIHYLSQCLSNGALYYLSGVPRGDWRRMEHRRCSVVKCLSMDIDKTDYIQQHAAGCVDRGTITIDVGAGAFSSLAGEGCTPMKVNVEDLASIIEDRDGIPLISCVINNDTVQARVTRAEFGTEYVAISHVWAGGMGNPDINALPVCQIHRLKYLVQSLLASLPFRTTLKHSPRSSRKEPVNFWIDTLCIPVDERFRSSRDKAIDLLPKTYSNARTVLVLDPELQLCQHKRLPIEMILARVQCSPWMSRYWTLQEASLARSWYIQFADGALHAVEALHKAEALLKGLNAARPITEAWERRYLVAEFARTLFEMDGIRYESRNQDRRRLDWSLKLLEENQAHSFAQTWNNFLGRDTSRMSDLHQILAGMQDINVAAIRQLHNPADRMKTILKSHATLPVDILFCRCEKIPDVEAVNAWAPLYPQGQRMNYFLGCMRVHTDCLLIPPLVASRFHVCVTDSSALTCPKFKLDLGGIDQFWVEKPSEDTTVLLVADRNSAVLLFPKLGSRSKNQFDHHCDGALFRMRKRESNSLWLMYACSVQVFSYDRSQAVRDDLSGAVTEPPSVPIELESDGTRVFVDCSLGNWPTVPALYNSPESPVFEQPFIHIMFWGFALSKMIWTLALIVGLAAASRLGIERWPLIVCFAVEICFAMAEIGWYARFVIVDLEREAWVSNSNRVAGAEELSLYQLLNSRPLLLLGPRRALAMILGAVTFIVPGIIHRGSRWALWPATVILLELTSRSVYCVIWFLFPRWSWTKPLLVLLNEKVWPQVRETLLRARSSFISVNRERTPFQEDESNNRGYTWTVAIWPCLRESGGFFGRTMIKLFRSLIDKRKS